ncbi:DUF6279 family lipoprotein [Marinomonas sp. THO17]|uniref:DUF6279 family lipoprotein n=1 Tax=Marinomonas sp. THO17 TaxID=3149048 RepID=UPI00336C0E20
MKKTRLPLIIVFSFLLSACSTSFVYNNLDWLLYWYLDDYITLTAEQKSQLDDRVETWQAWHRAVELPKYQQQIDQLRNQLQSGPLDQQAWLLVFDEVQQSAKRLREKIAPELAELAKQLSPAQVEELLTEWQKNTQERIERRTNSSPEERLAERQEERIEEIEDNLGKLTPEQKDIVSSHIKKLKSTFEYRTAYQTRLQGIVKDLFNHPEDENFSSQLSALIIDPNQYKTAEHTALSEQNKIQYAQMMADLNLTLSTKQKQKLDESLADLSQTIQALVED